MAARKVKQDLQEGKNLFDKLQKEKEAFDRVFYRRIKDRDGAPTFEEVQDNFDRFVIEIIQEIGGEQT